MMAPRIPNPAETVPGALQALIALGGTVEQAGLPPTTHELVKLRASQINGCAVCLKMHAEAARKAGETEERLDTVAGWRDAPYFTAAERAALDLTEAITRIGDRSEPVSDAVWAQAALQYDEPTLAALVVAIANINVWNRINVSTRQVAGQLG
jgi:AhpD family alkylhydroperoxidase